MRFSWDIVSLRRLIGLAEPMGRIELPTYCLPCSCSATELHRRERSVLGTGVEPARPRGHWALNPARLPISPPQHGNPPWGAPRLYRNFPGKSKPVRLGRTGSIKIKNPSASRQEAAAGEPPPACVGAREEGVGRAQKERDDEADERPEEDTPRVPDVSESLSAVRR